MILSILESHRNTKQSPAAAKEHALKSIAKDLLIVPEIGKFQPNEEAVLVLQLIADGDAKGPNRFIRK